MDGRTDVWCSHHETADSRHSAPLKTAKISLSDEHFRTALERFRRLHWYYFSLVLFAVITSTHTPLPSTGSPLFHPLSHTPRFSLVYEIYCYWKPPVMYVCVSRCLRLFLRTGSVSTPYPKKSLNFKRSELNMSMKVLMCVVSAFDSWKKWSFHWPD